MNDADSSEHYGYACDLANAGNPAPIVTMLKKIEALEKINTQRRQELYEAHEERASYEAELSRLTKWISVKDRLPEDHGRFITHTYAGVTMMNLYQTGVGWKSIRGADAAYWNAVITHWMPLPEPPQALKGVE